MKLHINSTSALSSQKQLASIVKLDQKYSTAKKLKNAKIQHSSKHYPYFSQLINSVCRNKTPESQNKSMLNMTSQEKRKSNLS